MSRPHCPKIVPLLIALSCVTSVLAGCRRRADSLAKRYPERVDVAHRGCNSRRPHSVHLGLVTRFALLPAAPGSEKLDRPQKLRSFAPQELPTRRIHAHAFDETHAPLVDDDDLLAPASTLVKRWLELAGSRLENHSDAVVEPHDERYETIELLEIFELGRLLPTPDLRQPGERGQRVRADDDRGQKSLKLYDIEDPLAPTHEPVAEGLEVFIRERSEGTRAGQTVKRGGHARCR